MIHRLPQDQEGALREHFAGAFCTGGGHSAFSLLTSAELKTIASLGFFFNPRMNDDELLENNDMRLMMG
jgi:hypothetical protein